MNKIKIVVNDLMQDYEYWLTEPIGKNFALDFKPELTPKQMLSIGVFGGKYMTDCQNEFPLNWYKNAKLCTTHHDPNLNFFGVNSGQSWQTWFQNGWLYEDDLRGWFQWYCRYFFGRRHEKDSWQILRWKKYKRHLAQIKKNCGVRDFSCRKKQRQGSLHWAFDTRKI